MTVSDQLRSIADRLDAARAMKHEALDELAKVGRYVVQVLGASDEDLADSAAVPVAAGAGAEDGGGTSAVPVAPTDAGAVGTAPTPARHAGGAGSTPAPRSNTCPECGKKTPTPAGLVTHRSRMHHVRPGVLVDAERQARRGGTNGAPPTVIRKGVEVPVEPPPDRRWPQRPTIAERIAQRDAGRAAHGAKQGRQVGGGA